MNKLQKMRRLIQQTKKYSILSRIQSRQNSKATSLQKKNNSVQKQKEFNFSLVSVLTLEPNLQNSTYNIKSQEKSSIDSNLSENGLTLRLKKVQNFAPCLTLRQQRSMYYETVKNVSSLIAKPMATDVRINKSQFNRKTIKSLKTRETQEETLSIQDKKMNVEVLVLQKPKRLRRSPKKIACKTASKGKRALSPKRQTSPLKGMKINGWQVSQQPQFEWQ